MEDNFYEISKAWRQLDESWARSQAKTPPKGPERTPGKQVHKPKKGAGSYNRNKFKKAIDETAGGAAGNGGSMAPAQSCGVTGAKGIAVHAKKLGMRENFDIANIGKPAPAVKPPMAPTMEEPVDMGMDTESPAVSDIIAGIQARYPGAIVEISVTAPDGHRFTDEDIACATEVANASNVPDELGGAWAKTGGEEGEEGGEEGDEEGTKPINEAYPPSFGGGDKEEGGETEEAGEDDGSEKEEAGEDEGGEEKSEKPSFGGEEKEEGGEGEEGIESCSGISQDCITLCPEEWSAFLVKADQGMGGEEGTEMGGEMGGEETGEETGEVDEGISDPGPGGSGLNHRELQKLKQGGNKPQVKPQVKPQIPPRA